MFIPEEFIQRIEAAGDEGARVGVELAVELIEQLKRLGAGHLYDAAVPSL